MKKGLLIKNAAEVVTCRGQAPKAGKAMNDLDIIANGAVVIEQESITAVGSSEEIVKNLNMNEYDVIDANGKCIMPGFIDSHTHFVFAGYRAEEFSWRLRGDTYMEIMERGGGIASTVRATRQASQQELKDIAIQRLNSMLALGVTTVEGKSGYGLDKDTEIKQLQVMRELADHPVEIVPTFMGAHAVPSEYKGRGGEYIEYVIENVLPYVAENKLAEFCDVFCEKGVFSIDESRRMLLAAQKLGLLSKIHADEIVPLGGAELAAEVGAVSADHLLHISEQGIGMLAEKKVVATLLPATAFSLKEPYAPGRKMIDMGVPVALATDFNPGSCYTESIPLVIALATLYMGLTPAEVVTALTINAAAALSRADTIGSIEVGKQADIIMLEHPSYLYLPYHIGMSIVNTVIKKGQVVWCKNN